MEQFGYFIDEAPLFRSVRTGQFNLVAYSPDQDRGILAIAERNLTHKTKYSVPVVLILVVRRPFGQRNALHHVHPVLTGKRKSTVYSLHIPTPGTAGIRAVLPGDVQAVRTAYTLDIGLSPVDI